MTEHGTCSQLISSLTDKYAIRSINPTENLDCTWLHPSYQQEAEAARVITINGLASAGLYRLIATTVNASVMFFRSVCASQSAVVRVTAKLLLIISSHVTTVEHFSITKASVDFIQVRLLVRNFKVGLTHSLVIMMFSTLWSLPYLISCFR